MLVQPTNAPRLRIDVELIAQQVVAKVRHFALEAFESTKNSTEEQKREYYRHLFEREVKPVVNEIIDDGFDEVVYCVTELSEKIFIDRANVIAREFFDGLDGRHHHFFVTQAVKTLRPFMGDVEGKGGVPV